MATVLSWVSLSSSRQGCAGPALFPDYVSKAEGATASRPGPAPSGLDTLHYVLVLGGLNSRGSRQRSEAVDVPHTWTGGLGYGLSSTGTLRRVVAPRSCVFPTLCRLGG